MTRFNPGDLVISPNGNRGVIVGPMVPNHAFYAIKLDSGRQVSAWHVDITLLTPRPLLGNLTPTDIETLRGMVYRAASDTNKLARFLVNSTAYRGDDLTAATRKSVLDMQSDICGLFADLGAARRYHDLTGAPQA